MTAPQMPSEDHERFDAICSRLGDWEPLPAVVSAPQELAEDDERIEQEQATPMNELILAGLVAPS